MSNPTVGVQEAAVLMKVHYKTVEDLIADGKLPAGKVGRSWVMLTRDVLAHVEKTIIDQTAARMGLPKPYQRRAAKSLPRRLA